MKTKYRIICFLLTFVLCIPMFSNICVADDDDEFEKGWIEEHPQYQKNVDSWIKTASVNIVTRDVADGKVKKTLQGVVDDALTELGFEKGTYSNAMYKYIISHDSKGELLSAALEGDTKTMQEKTASLMSEYLVKKVLNKEGAGNIADIVIDGSKGDNWAEKAINLSKSIQKKVFPYIDLMDKFAGLVESCTNIWAGNTMEDIYKAYKDIAGSGDTISDEEWNRFSTTNDKAFNVYKDKGISEEAIREKFRERVANEKKIAKKEAELQKLVKIWDRNMLLNPYNNNYPSDWTVEDRLRSLYEIRELMIQMFTKDGKLQKGSYTNYTDEEFIEELVYEWVAHGIKDRDGFYKWLEEEEIVKKGTFTEKKEDTEEKEKEDKKKENKEEKDGEKDDQEEDEEEEEPEEIRYVWVLTDVVNEIAESGKSSFNEHYSAEYSGSQTTHFKHEEFNDRGDHEEGSFTSTWDIPPAVLAPDETISLHLQIQANGDSGLLFSDSITAYVTDYEGEDTYFNHYYAMRDIEDEYSFSVSTSPYAGLDGDYKHSEGTVSGTLGTISEDWPKTIVIASGDSKTYFIYKYMEYDSDKAAQAEDYRTKLGGE